jgi:hypothetical protein
MDRQTIHSDSRKQAKHDGVASGANFASWISLEIQRGETDSAEREIGQLLAITKCVRSQIKTGK